MCPVGSLPARPIHALQISGSFVHQSCLLITHRTLKSLRCRVVLENGERLSAVAAVREAENRLLSARARPGGSSALELLQRVIGLAGAQCTPQVGANSLPGFSGVHSLACTQICSVQS